LPSNWQHLVEEADLGGAVTRSDIDALREGGVGVTKHVGQLPIGGLAAMVNLRDELGARLVSARDVLRDIAGVDLSTRETLQAFGARIEEETDGSWLADWVGVPTEVTIVDSARTIHQTQAFRASGSPLVLLHLTASDSERRRRFERGSGSDRSAPRPDFR
jgi:hypothetical protein